MAYDSARAVTVLYGGSRLLNSQFIPFGDTWEWDGVRWSVRFPAQAPPVGSPHSIYYYGPMAFDRRRARCVLFGGHIISGWVGQDLGDTWEWDGSNWQQMQSGPPRSGHSMAFDEHRGRLVVAGGTVPYQPTPTVERDGPLWLGRSATLTVVGASMAYDTRRRRVVLFGGLSALQPLADTWEYSSTAPASYSAFGAGCPGSAGTPVLSTAPFELPWTGTTFSVDLTSLPPAGAVSMYTGFSRTSWGPFSLPLPLDPWGMPGCTLSVAAELGTPVPNQNGTGRFSLAVPLSTSLAGLPFYNQALVLDPAANPTGAILSNAGEGQIGMK